MKNTQTNINIFSNISLFWKVNIIKGGLHEVVRTGDEKLLKRYVSGGWDLNGVNEVGPPIYYAIVYDKLDCARLLLKGGAAVDTLTPDGRTALHVAAETGNKTAIELLLEFGADPYCEDHSCNTPISIAQKFHFPEVVKLLQKNAHPVEETEGISAMTASLLRHRNPSTLSFRA